MAEMRAEAPCISRDAVSPCQLEAYTGCSPRPNANFPSQSTVHLSEHSHGTQLLYSRHSPQQSAWPWPNSRRAATEEKRSEERRKRALQAQAVSPGEGSAQAPAAAGGARGRGSSRPAVPPSTNAASTTAPAWTRPPASKRTHASRRDACGGRRHCMLPSTSTSS